MRLWQKKQEKYLRWFIKSGRPPENIPEISYSLGGQTEPSQALISSLMSRVKYASRSAVRRLIEQGAVSVDGVKINLNNIPQISDGTIVKVGKANFFRIAKKKLIKTMPRVMTNEVLANIIENNKQK